MQLKKSGKTENGAVNKWQSLINSAAAELDFEGLNEGLKKLVLDSFSQESEALDLKAYLKALAAAKADSAANWNQLCKPLHSLGVLESSINQIYALQTARRGRSFDPRRAVSLQRGLVAVFAADNGVVAEGVSQVGAEVTATVLKNIAQKKASVAILAQDQGLDILAVNLGCRDLPSSKTVESDNLSTELLESIAQAERIIAADSNYLDFVLRPAGSRNLMREAALSKTELIAAIAFGYNLGIYAGQAGYDFVIGGEMGIGNTTSSTALAAAILAIAPAEIAGRGAGLSDAAYEQKVQVLQQALERCAGISEPLGLLAALGGFDIAALVGFYLAAFVCSLPVLLDGLITIVAATVASLIIPEVSTVLIPTHRPREKASLRLLAKLGLEAPLELDLALGEGAGALFYLPILRAANLIYRKLPSFAEGKVEQYKDFKDEEAK
ncbi:MAG: nicotinate-nucleotide--dimethylbenzimidazole phosphoribosyltransferase [Eubacteriales bacterium]|nr:nicotinate-nucleotide--dimethylbenzimidazole phosphoribosyltransferase [Eubacteriales bacterium]